MPLLIVLLVIAAASGLLLQRRTAWIVTSISSVLVIGSFTWTIADGEGSDPPWLLPMALVVCVVALALTAGLARARSAQANG
jgi:hypothetical protein